ncbi:hypothetical protein, partial [Acinetobacter baumannii]|uniref:hypothetical protein n=1 Tax=Acinetobacter baumannii TaxID=470 RepID=UPI002FE2179F
KLSKINPIHSIGHVMHVKRNIWDLYWRNSIHWGAFSFTLKPRNLSPFKALFIDRGRIEERGRDTAEKGHNVGVCRTSIIETNSTQ